MGIFVSIETLILIKTRFIGCLNIYVAYADNLNGSPVRYTEMMLTTASIFMALDGTICVYSGRYNNTSTILATSFTVEHGTTSKVTLKCACDIKEWLSREK